MYLLPVVLSLSLVVYTIALSRAEKGKLISVVKAEDGQFQVVNEGHPDAIVNASFNNVINKPGWSFLELVGSSDVLDEELAFAAGMAEGWATGDLILMQWKNTLAGMCAKPSNLCTKMAQFIANNSLYMAAQFNKSAGMDSYWYHVNLFTTQLKGLLEGYNMLRLEELTYSDLLLMQISGDLESLLSVLSNKEGKKEKENVEEEVQLKVVGASKCSALVKLLYGNAELFVSHDTWDDYQGMLRVFKLYNLKFQTSKIDSTVIPRYRVSFSSYPGMLLSGDDFYMMSSGLVTTETTLGNSNPALWQYVVPETVFEGIRNVVANRLACSGKNWSEVFSHHNSGTYNNQWMVVDYKLFEKGQEQLKNGLLWVLEQLPGIITAGDQTDACPPLI